MLLVALFGLFSLTRGFCADSWPNGTANDPNFWTCDGQATFLSVATYLPDGRTHSYPINIQQPILLKTTMINNGGLLPGTDLRSTIDLYQYTGQDIPNCYWSAVPTYGSLNEEQPCSDSINCPIPSNAQDFHIEIHFEKMSPAVLNMLRADGDIQLRYRLLDSAYNVRMCLMVQMRAYYN